MIEKEYKLYHESKKHGDLRFPYNTYLCSIPLLFRQVPLHWHDEMEIIYIKKGEGVVTVDLNSHHVAEGTLILVLPGQLHSIEQFENSSMEYENIIFHPDLLMTGGMDICSMDYLHPILSGKVPIPSVVDAACSFYDEIAGPVDACDEICKTMPAGYELYIKSMLFRLFFVLNARYGGKQRRDADRRNLEKMKPILKYVEAHFAEKITIAEIADLAGFSESHFMRYFKKMMATSFVDYLKDYRLTKASEYLQSSEETILVVAESVGFDNLSYFNRAFKAKYGITPGQYRHNS